MADDQQQLQIVISAIDNASATLKQMSSNVSQSTGQINDSSEKAGSSFSSLTASIVVAEAAYEALVKVGEMVKSFFEESINAAIKQSATMAQVKVDVDNAGLAYSAVGPQIEALAAQNETLGFANNDTALSMGKLILATGNYDDALKLNALAMDLSRAKGIDLNSATVMLQQVMAGNTRVLKQYGISLDSSTTSAEALNILQGKLQGSASAFADTSAGKLEEVRAQWEHIQEQVGDRLMPIMDDLFNAFEANLPVITQFLTGMANAAVDIYTDIKQIGTTTDAFEIISVAAQGVLKYLKLLKDALDAIADEMRVLSGTTQEFANSQEETTAALQKTIDGFNKLHPQLGVTTEEFRNMSLGAQKALIDQVGLAEKSGLLADATAKVSTNFDDIKNHVTKAGTALLTHTEIVTKLTDEYNKMVSTGKTDLASLADAFETKMASIQDDIAKTKQSIVDLTSGFNKTNTDETASVADDIVASEYKIADIKKQLAAATTQDQITQLQLELAAEQKNYDSSVTFKNANAAAITEAERRASETSLQREIEDFATKQKLEAADYQKKLDTLNKELLDKGNEAIKELQIYQSKVAQINGILDTANAYFIKLSNDRKSQTQKEVDAEIAAFQALAAAISQTKSASQSALSQINIPSPTGFIGPLPAHESGGFVNAPRGTAVPIMAHGGEVVIPAEQAGSVGKGGSTISITINNPNVRSQDDINQLRKQLEDLLRPVLLNAKVIHT